MSTEYVGSGIWPVSITCPTDDDEFDVASVDVPLQQLRDGEVYLKGLIEDGIGFEFHDAILHGATNFPDGSIDANVDRMNLNASENIALDASTDLLLHSGQDFLLQANRDATINVFRNFAMDVAGTVVLTGADSIDLLGGLVTIAPGTIELGANVNLGGGTSDAIEVRGSLAAMHNATFAVGKTVSLNGVTTAADLTATALKATVSTSNGITYSGSGRAHYRDRLMTNADMSGGPFHMHPDVADFFYVTALTADGYAKIDTGGSSINGDVIEVSTLGMSGGFNLYIYAADETTLLLTMTATSNSWSRWKRLSTGAWRCLGVSDG